MSTAQATAAPASWRDTPTLRGQHVWLEPLTMAHVDGLISAASDGALWTQWTTTVPAPDAMAAYVAAALSDCASGDAMPFAVRDAAGTVVGSTRFGCMEWKHRRVEIGWTWYAQRVQRTGLNTEAKLLLLGHAFEQLGCISVQFYTHWFNFRSRAAIARLGAKQDGVLRNHMCMPDGGKRDTVVFSIIDSEWPTVQQHLRQRLQHYASPAASDQA